MVSLRIPLKRKLGKKWKFLGDYFLKFLTLIEIAQCINEIKYLFFKEALIFSNIFDGNRQRRQQNTNHAFNKSTEPTGLSNSNIGPIFFAIWDYHSHVALYNLNLFNKIIIQRKRHFTSRSNFNHILEKSLDYRRYFPWRWWSVFWRKKHRLIKTKINLHKLNFHVCSSSYREILHTSDRDDDCSHISHILLTIKKFESMAKSAIIVEHFCFLPYWQKKKLSYWQF